MFCLQFISIKSIDIHISYKKQFLQKILCFFLIYHSVYVSRENNYEYGYIVHVNTNSRKGVHVTTVNVHIADSKCNFFALPVV